MSCTGWFDHAMINTFTTNCLRSLATLRWFWPLCTTEVLASRHIENEQCHGRLGSKQSAAKRKESLWMT